MEQLSSHGMILGVQDFAAKAFTDLKEQLVKEKATRG
jgi:hypothetical protein